MFQQTPLTFLRHAEPDWSHVVQRGVKGWGFDLAPLSKNGILDTEELARNRPFTLPSLIVSSSTVRTLHTTSILSKSWGVPFEIAFGLHEWIPDLTLSWHSHNQVTAAEKEYYSCKGKWPSGTKKSWETSSMILDRTQKVLSQYSTCSNLLVVAHASVIRVLTGKTLQYCEFASALLEDCLNVDRQSAF